MTTAAPPPPPPEDHPFAKMDTLSELLDQARDDALSVLNEHRELAVSLGIVEEGRVLPLYDISLIISEAMYEASTSKEQRHRLKPLFELLCAANILNSWNVLMRPEPNETACYLLPLWHGRLSVVKWMDEDGIMSAFKEVFRAELASLDVSSRNTRANARRAELIAPFEVYVRDRIRSGYKGKAPALVVNVLKLPAFKDLAEATEPRRFEDGTTKNALIKRQRLEDLVRRIIEDFQR